MMVPLPAEHSDEVVTAVHHWPVRVGHLSRREWPFGERALYRLMSESAGPPFAAKIERPCSAAEEQLVTRWRTPRFLSAPSAGKQSLSDMRSSPSGLSQARSGTESVEAWVPDPGEGATAEVCRAVRGQAQHHPPSMSRVVRRVRPRRSPLPWEGGRSG
jgi:hypothetical protein